jgi:hypothetical protein
MPTNPIKATTHATVLPSSINDHKVNLPSGVEKTLITSLAASSIFTAAESTASSSSIVASSSSIEASTTWTIQQSDAQKMIENLSNETPVSSDGTDVCFLRNILVGFIDQDEIELDLSPFIDGTMNVSGKEKNKAVEVINNLIMALQATNTADLAKNIISLKETYSEDSLALNILFRAMDHLGLDNLKKDHFEPFHQNFPSISVHEYPESLTILGLQESNASELSRIDFPKFRLLETLDLSLVQNLMLKLPKTFLGHSSLKKIISPGKLDLGSNRGLTAEKFNAVFENAATTEIIFPRGINVSEFDFSKLVNIEKLDLSNVQGLTAQQFNAIPKGQLQELVLPKGQNVKEFIFSDLLKIRVLHFDHINTSYNDKLNYQQFNSIPKGELEVLSFASDGHSNNCHIINSFDFSKLVKIRELYLEGVYFTNSSGVTPQHLNAIPNKSLLKKLSLPEYMNIAESTRGRNGEAKFDFSEFKLDYLDMHGVIGLTAEVFNQQFAGSQIKKIAFPDRVNLSDFNLEILSHLKHISFHLFVNLTAEQFNIIVGFGKVNSFYLDWDVSTAGFDLSKFDPNRDAWNNFSSIKPYKRKTETL